MTKNRAGQAPGVRVCSLRPSPNRVRGFTLVELLVVIGIIALLIGILLPALNKARANGQWAACLSNMRQLGQAMTMYAQEYKGNLPRPASNGNGYMPDDFIIWRDQPLPNPQIEETVLAKFLNSGGDKLKSMYRCPNDVYDDRPTQSGFTFPYKFSYTMNKAWDMVPGTVATPILTRTRPKVSQVRRPAEKVLLVEEKLPNDGRFEYANVGAGGADELCDRHSGQGNVLFHDGHVERRYWKELQSQGTNGDMVFDIYMQ